jgi:YHS domain-containing protein
MRTYATPLLAGALALGLSTAAFAATSGQFKDMCAWGLANHKEVQTDCTVKSDYKGKTYCFSSEEAKADFMKHPKANLAKAEKNYTAMESKS